MTICYIYIYVRQTQPKPEVAGFCLPRTEQPFHAKTERARERKRILALRKLGISGARRRPPRVNQALFGGSTPGEGIKVEAVQATT